MRCSYVCAIFAISLLAGISGHGTRTRCVQSAMDIVGCATTTTTRVPEDYVARDRRSVAVLTLEEGK